MIVELTSESFWTGTMVTYFRFFVEKVYLDSLGCAGEGVPQWSDSPIKQYRILVQNECNAGRKQIFDIAETMPVNQN